MAKPHRTPRQSNPRATHPHGSPHALWEALPVTARWWPDPRCAPVAYLTGWRVPPEVLALSDDPAAVEVFFELENATARGVLAELQGEAPTPTATGNALWIVNRMATLSVAQLVRIVRHLSSAALHTVYVLEDVHFERREVLAAIVARVRWLAERYSRKPLHGRRLAQVKGELRAQAEQHGHSMRQEIAERIASAQWTELWSPPSLPPQPDPLRYCLPLSPDAIHSAIAQEVTQGLVGPDPDRKRGRNGQPPLERSIAEVARLSPDDDHAARRRDAKLELYVLCQRAKRQGLSLSEAQEHVLELYCQDLTQEEIGRRLGKPRGTVKTHLDRLTEKLRAVARVG